MMDHKGASAEPSDESTHSGIQRQQHEALLPNH